MPGPAGKVKHRTADAREVELKLLLDREAVGILKTLPVIGPALKKAKQSRLTSAYYDTRDRCLEKAGLTLRLRSDGKKNILTVKTAGSAAIDRGEWERRVRGNKPVAKDIAASPAAGVLDKRVSALRPLFTTKVERSKAVITHKAAHIELALDQGLIESGKYQLPICELELELKGGKRAGLLALARELAALAPLRLSFIAKSERGHRLLARAWGKPKSASTPELTPAMSALDAFFAIARTCLHDFMLNEVALTKSDDIEGVHQARIAIRRLRAAFSLFAPRLADPRFEVLAGELAWLSDLLGAARDCDVLLSEFAPDPKSPAGAAIIERRLAAHRALAEGLASGRMRLLLIDLAGALDAGTWSKTQALPLSAPVCDVAGELLDGRLKKLLKSARDLHKLDAHKRHRLRIAAKKLRYMGEFFETLLAREQQKQDYETVIGELEKVQKRLGVLQDDATFQDLLAEILDKAEAKEMAGGSRIDRKAELQKALRAMAKLAEAEPFWLKWRK